ncbi:MAG: hypothetical protein ABIB43_06870 [archaeon]
MKLFILQKETRTLEKVVNGSIQFFMDGRLVNEKRYLNELETLNRKVEAKPNVYYAKHIPIEGNEMGLVPGDEISIYDNATHTTDKYIFWQRKKITWAEQATFMETHKIPFAIEIVPERATQYQAIPSPPSLIGHYS